MKKKIKKTYKYKLGERFHVKNEKHSEEILCAIGHLNQGIGFLFPVVDDPENPSIATHICYAKIDRYGKLSFV